MKSAFSLHVLALAALLAACGQPSPKPESEPSQAAAGAAARPQSGFDLTAAGTPAPDLALEMSDGQQQTIADIRAANPGLPILVNLWATWCAPCLKELPTLDSLAAKTAGKLVIVPISQDMEGWQKVNTVFTAKAFPNLHTRLDSRMRYGHAIGAHALPVSIYYDAQGREIWRYLGDFDWASDAARSRLGL